MRWTTITKKKTNDEPVLTQRMTLHLNGGNKYSQLHYEVLADDEPTGITIHKYTNGSPDYKYTAFEVRCGDETLDVMKAKKGEMMEWIRARLPRQSGAGGRKAAVRKR